ncbi:hypothetical protein FD723_37815 (plasmid) [Nostoc sp. C052]|nr:hypothetical protein FD723_37815 [Nostoc sp. C052]
MERRLMKKMKRDIQGKFALKNDDYREVRSLRLTDNTWKKLGIASECLGLTRADYLEEIINREFSPCNTWKDSASIPGITRNDEELNRLKAQVQYLQKENSAHQERSAVTFVYDIVDFEAIRDRILFELKLGRQASGYKAAQKALNTMIAELKLLVDSF